MSLTFRRSLAPAIMLIFLMAGCARPSQVGVHLVGDHDQNRGNAIVVHIYQLSGRTNFDRANVVEFWRNDTAVLGAELLDAKQLTMLPDDKQTQTITPVPNAQFLAIAADFMEPGDKWRQIMLMKAVNRKQVTI